MTATPSSPPPGPGLWERLLTSVALPILVTLLIQPVALRFAPPPALVPVDCTSYVMTISRLDTDHVELDEQRLALVFDERTLDVCGSPAEVLLVLEPQRGP